MARIAKEIVVEVDSSNASNSRDISRWRRATELLLKTEQRHLVKPRAVTSGII